MRTFRDLNPTTRWLARRRWWDRWGPVLALVIPLVVLIIVVFELLRLGKYYHG